MLLKKFATVCIASTIALAPAQQAAADSGLVGGIVGGIVGGAIVNSVNNNRRATTPQRTYRKSSSNGGSVPAATREANREMQVALNYFGYPVGTPDGVIGPKSRDAISRYQASMGFAPTGNLNTFERDLLVQSYYRAQAGGAQTVQAIATNPRGAQGLLLQYRDEKLNVAPNAGQYASAPATAPQSTLAAASVPQLSPGSDAAPQTAGTSMPNFMGQGAAKASLASHCNKTSLLTNSNGGFVTPATMDDPAFALSEQFCLARTYAIAQGEDLASKVPGFTPQQITSQCETLGPMLKDYVAALSLQPKDAVLQQVSGFVLKSGMAPAQLASTARICLGVGYVTDNMDVAIGSALVLTVLGEKAYAELVGHHLAAGIGAAQRPDLALSWFDMALGEGSEGTVQVFAPGMTDRTALVRQAAYAAAGRSIPASGGAEMPVPAAAVPDFAVPKASANP